MTRVPPQTPRIMPPSVSIGVVLATAMLAACYQYRAHAPNQPGVTDKGEVVWSFFWGLAHEQPKITDCNDQPLAEVTVKDNLGFSLLTVVSLGTVSPKRVEWKCAAARPSEGELRPDTCAVR